MRYPKQAIFLIITSLCIWGSLVHAKHKSSIPHYKIDVTFQLQQRKLTGKMEIHYSADAYPAEELLFALPMNRFLNKDSRGPRKVLTTPTFGLDKLKKVEDDPDFPYGFDKGHTEIKIVTDINNIPLAYSISDNPTLAVGYSIRNGLLKVKLPTTLPKSIVVIEFETYLPRRFQEGLIEKDLTTIEWHPVLLAYKKGQWITHLNEPSPGTYEVIWSSKTAGTLITTTEDYVDLKPHQKVILPVSKQPLKYFPLIFSPRYQHLLAPSNRLNSFYFGRNQRRAVLLQRWGEEFLDFIKERYGLPLPWEKIKVIEVRSNREQIRAVNNLVLMASPHYQRTAFLDRRVLGFFIKGMAEVWFGERVWNNVDTQLWLSMGIPKYFSLRFFEYKFGSEARIFSFFDWMNPHYREHFYESMIYSIRQKLDMPIITSVQKATETRILMKIVNYKVALVMSMLEYLVEPDVFRKALLRFYMNHSYRVATVSNLRESVEYYYQEDLNWFFVQWFHTTKKLDYALEDISFEKRPDGKYESRIVVRRIGSAIMPIEVELHTEDGKVRKKIRGKDKYSTVTFITTSPPEDVSLDPDEHLLEKSRINNHSFFYFRVRFAFDWKKEREILITLVPVIGSNAIDGNMFGLNTRNEFGDYIIEAVPGYGTKNNRLLYFIKLERQNLGWKGFSGNILFSEFGGIRSRGVGMKYASPKHREKLSYNFSTDIAQESAFKTRKEDETNGDVEESGDVSNFELRHEGNVGFRNFYFITWKIAMEQPLVDLGAEFNYVLWKVEYEQIFNIGFRKRIQWDLLYGTTFGESPLQKKHQLGGPSALRGYPQRALLGKLRDDNMIVSRLDYKYPLVFTQWWGNISTLGIQGTVFYDQGKVWSKNQTPTETLLRQDVGVGIEWTLDAFSLGQLPLAIEISRPVNDPEFEKTYLIVFRALSFELF